MQIVGITVSPSMLEQIKSKGLDNSSDTLSRPFNSIPFAVDYSSSGAMFNKWYNKEAFEDYIASDKCQSGIGE